MDALRNATCNDAGKILGKMPRLSHGISTNSSCRESVLWGVPLENKELSMKWGLRTGRRPSDSGRTAPGGGQKRSLRPGLPELESAFCTFSGGATPTPSGRSPVSDTVNIERVSVPTRASEREIRLHHFLIVGPPARPLTVLPAEKSLLSIGAGGPDGTQGDPPASVE